MDKKKTKIIVSIGYVHPEAVATAMNLKQNLSNSSALVVIIETDKGNKCRFNIPPESGLRPGIYRLILEE